MIDSISPINVQRSNAVSFKGELPYSKTQSQDKQGMSTTQKTLLGLGALAATTAGILLAKKRLDTKLIKNLEKKAKDGLQWVSPRRIGVAKPEKFDRSDVAKLIKKDVVKYGIKPGDSVVIIPTSIVKDDYQSWAKYLDKMSDNAFIYFYTRADRRFYGVTRYIAPKTITDPEISAALKKGELFECKIEG